MAGIMTMEPMIVAAIGAKTLGELSLQYFLAVMRYLIDFIGNRSMTVKQLLLYLYTMQTGRFAIMTLLPFLA